MLQLTKTILFLVKGLKVVAKRCLNWISFHDGLCCCVEYSNVESKLRFSILIIRTDAQKPIVEFSLGVDFITPIILNFEFFFVFLEFIIYLRASSQSFVENQ